MRRDIKYYIGRHEALLPFDHDLPRFQRNFPLYDRYFLEFMRARADSAPGLTLIDIGANVGDTALAVLTAAPGVKIFSVEGSEHFLPYLRRNLRDQENVEIVEAFVTHRPGRWSAIRDGGTGHIVEVFDGDAQADPAVHLSPSELLALVGGGRPCIWKSDTDGHDIPILLAAFDEIIGACEVVWIEFDPLGNLSDASDVTSLIEQLSGSERDVVVFDNFGHRIMRFRSGLVAEGLAQLVEWLAIQDESTSRRVFYFDLWLLPSPLADVLCSSTQPNRT